jgi:hypothetical protein
MMMQQTQHMEPVLKKRNSVKNAPSSATSNTKHKSKYSVASSLQAQSTRNANGFNHANTYEFNLQNKPPMGKMSLGMDNIRKVPLVPSAASKTSLPTGATSTRSSKKLRSRQNSVKSINHFKNFNYPERMSLVGMHSQAGNSNTPARREMAHQ